MSIVKPVGASRLRSGIAGYTAIREMFGDISPGMKWGTYRGLFAVYPRGINHGPFTTKPDPVPILVVPVDHSGTSTSWGNYTFPKVKARWDDCRVVLVDAVQDKNGTFTFWFGGNRENEKKALREAGVAKRMRADDNIPASDPQRSEAALLYATSYSLKPYLTTQASNDVLLELARLAGV